MPKFSTVQTFRILFYLILTGVTVMFLMPVPKDAGSLINDKLAHLVIFFVLAYLIDQSYREYNFLMVLTPSLITYGLLIEALQGFSAYRTFSLLDWVADSAGIMLYTVVSRAFMQKSKVNDSSV